MSKYETIIGLEIHVQLRTESKMFCACDNYSVDAKPNTNVCPVCMGMPGMLPVANKKAIEWTYLLGMALGAVTAEKFNFERKNYFYPDLPKAYQITSSTNPPVLGGSVNVDIDGIVTTIRTHHIHLEEDAGKLVHPTGVKYSLVDLNRAGTPLMEIVTEPDIRSPHEASVFLQDLRSIIRYLGISDANMEQGNLRCDANVSLRPIGQKELGTKVEIKNMNSFKMIERALAYEVKRQTEMLDAGKKIMQETRGWDDSKGITVEQRSKEEANDYRYFPEPDLPPFELCSDDDFRIEEMRKMLPELPKEKCQRFTSEYGLSSSDARQLTDDLELAHYFEKAIGALPDDIIMTDEVKRTAAKKIANWILGELIGRLNKFSVQLSETKVLPEQLADLVSLIDSGSISGKQAKEVFNKMFETGQKPSEIITVSGLGQISNKDELGSVVDNILTDNVKSVEDFKAGKQQAFGYLVGQIMAATKGQANPRIVNEILKEKLSK
jgi:aspartyl-tRNA(Asn)/glutamyl-tRNA(Gln) amidotransferase subunit B